MEVRSTRFGFTASCFGWDNCRATVCLDTKFTGHTCAILGSDTSRLFVYSHAQATPHFKHDILYI